MAFVWGKNKRKGPKEWDWALGTSPLQLICRYGYNGLTRGLLIQGAKVKEKDPNGKKIKLIRKIEVKRLYWYLLGQPSELFIVQGYKLLG